MSKWLRFLFCVWAIPLSFYAASYRIIRSPAFCAHSNSFFDVSPCYKFNVQGVSADTLLVGDSSLLYGIIPSVVAQAGGGSSYNFGLVGAAFAFDPQQVIDRYLAMNGRPKAIVVYFNPYAPIQRHQMYNPHWWPDALLIGRYGRLADWLALWRAQPSALVETPALVLHSLHRSTTPMRAWRAQMERDGGRLDFGATLTPSDILSAECRPAPLATAVPQPYSDTNRSSLRSLREHYAAQGLPVYIYVAPTAECDGRLDEVRAAYAGVADNRPETLPSRYFAGPNDVPEHVHLDDEGAAVASGLLGRFLAQHRVALGRAHVAG